jgi:hypothetical protein
MPEKEITTKELYHLVIEHEKRLNNGDKRFDGLATKEDIREMKEAFSDFITALKIFKAGSKWGYRALLVVASIVIAVVGIGGGFKTILGWFTK